MEIFELMAWVAGAIAVAGLIALTSRTENAINLSWLIPAGFSVAFLVWSLWAIALEGPTGFWPVHAKSAWGNQVWFDLLLAVSIAWYLILPRAREVGMRVWLWLVVVVCSGSIGLLAMLARYLFLSEKQRA